MNPGSIEISEKIMQISDILDLEENWIDSNSIAWKSAYTSDRFMGISSNEYCKEHYFQKEFCLNNVDDAVNATTKASNEGIGYFFATDRYTELPNWFEQYILQITEINQERKS